LDDVSEYPYVRERERDPYLLVAFTETLRWRDLVALGARRCKIWMLRMQKREEPVEKQVIADG
jgi:hypothetical protein